MLRGERVMFDFHLAALYNVETRSLKQAVRRNADRFPEDFMFELTDKEVDFLRSQNVISNEGRGGLCYAPMAFTEQGVAMLASVFTPLLVFCHNDISEIVNYTNNSYHRKLHNLCCW